VGPRTGLDAVETRKKFPLPGFEPRPSSLLLYRLLIIRCTEEKVIPISDPLKRVNIDHKASDTFFAGYVTTLSVSKLYKDGW
jgi:hypothetical protein